MSAELPEAITLQALVQRFGGRVARGDPQRVVRRLASLTTAGADDLSFLTSAPFKAQAESTRAGAVLVGAALADAIPPDPALVIVDDAYAYYAHVAGWIAGWRETRESPPAGVHPSAVVAPDAELGEGVAIGPGCVVEAEAVIGAGVRLGPGCFVGRGARIGARSRLVAQVSLYAGCVLGEDVLVHASTVIGSDGFGFAPEAGQWVKIPQLGRVVVGKQVEIGSNCAIDRGALDDTVIGDGCKLDNLIQIGHNVRIGEHSVLAGCTGVSGSAVIGKRCRLGGGVGIVGHLQICDDVTITGMTMVTRSITSPGTYSSSFPMMEHAAWERAAATVRQLPELRQRLRKLEKLSGNR
ncbi:MAG: UDP-3-O-(3-hydroxymyristoyl)glucosamine N-acyltransferase [Burkholderiaceae bacterium]